MKSVGTFVIALAVIAIGAVGLFSACSGAAASLMPTGQVSGQPTVAKPKPVVLAISATTSGIFEGYFAILDVTVKNDGADGMVILISSVKQGNKDITSELPTYLAHDMTQTVRAVLPIDWRAGEWTPSATVEVP